MQLDLELVNLAKNGDSAAFEKLSNFHSGIVIKTFQKYGGAIGSFGLNSQDLYQEKDTVIYNCCRTFDPSYKVKFSTWVANHARFHCLNTLNSLNKNKILDSLDKEDVRNVLEGKIIEESYFLNEEVIDFVFEILKDLKDKRILKIFKLRYYEGRKNLSWAKIGVKMGFSAQTAINLHAKGRKFILAKLKHKKEFDKMWV